MTGLGPPWVSPFGLDQPEGRLLARTLRPYRLRILLRGEVEAGQRCVAVGPGAATLALLLAEVVGPGGEVLVLDPSREGVRAGRAMVSTAHVHNVELEDVHLDGSCGVQLPALACDVLYTVNLLAVSADLEAAGEVLSSALPAGTLVVMEEQDLDRSGGAGSTTPALRRWQHLRGELARWRSGHADGAGRAPLLLGRHGFRVDEVEAAQPAFVQGVGCRIPLAELKATRTALVEAGLLTEEGVEELTMELATETGTPGQLVLWPRVVFVRATRVPTPANGHGARTEQALL